MSEAMKNIWVAVITVIGSLAGSTFAIYLTRSLEVEKVNIAKVEAITKLKSELTSDSLREREVAYEAIRSMGFDILADNLKFYSLTPDRLRIHVQNESQKKVIGEIVHFLGMSQSVIYIAQSSKKQPTVVEIYYFDDRDWNIAHHVADLVGQSPIVRRGPKNNGAKGDIEVWLPLGYKPPVVTSRWTEVYEPKAPKGVVESLFCR